LGNVVVQLFVKTRYNKQKHLLTKTKESFILLICFYY